MTTTITINDVSLDIEFEDSILLELIDLIQKYGDYDPDYDYDLDAIKEELTDEQND